jgi:hypothetical protein
MQAAGTLQQARCKEYHLFSSVKFRGGETRPFFYGKHLQLRGLEKEDNLLRSITNPVASSKIYTKLLRAFLVFHMRALFSDRLF